MTFPRATKVPAWRRTLPAALFLAALGTVGSPSSAEADVPCPPLVGFLEGAPLPPRVGMSGSVTPFSPSDSAVFEAPVPFGGMRTRVNLTITAESTDFRTAPTVSYALLKVTGFDSTLSGVLTCSSTPHVSGSVTGTTGLWSTTIEETVFISDPPWNPPNFHLQVTGTTFADWKAEVTPCYVPRDLVTC